MASAEFEYVLLGTVAVAQQHPMHRMGSLIVPSD